MDRNRTRGSGVEIGSAGGPEAGKKDSRTSVDPRPTGSNPESQASHRALQLSEGRWPVAKRVEGAWLSRVERIPISSVFSILSVASPLCLSQPVPQKVLWLLLVQTPCSNYFAPPLGKCPVIWCLSSARCWCEQPDCTVRQARAVTHCSSFIVLGAWTQVVWPGAHRGQAAGVDPSPAYAARASQAYLALLP